MNTLLMTLRRCAHDPDEAALGAITASQAGVMGSTRPTLTVSLSARGLLSLAAGQWRVRLASHEECRRIAAVIDAVTAQPGIGARR